MVTLTHLDVPLYVGHIACPVCIPINKFILYSCQWKFMVKTLICTRSKLHILHESNVTIKFITTNLNSAKFSPAKRRRQTNGQEQHDSTNPIEQECTVAEIGRWGRVTWSDRQIWFRAILQFKYCPWWPSVKRWKVTCGVCFQTTALTPDECRMQLALANKWIIRQVQHRKRLQWR